MMRFLKYSAFVLVIAMAQSDTWSAELNDGVRAFEARRYPEAINILLPLANSGDAEAQRIIGEMSFNGQGMKRNFLAAFKWNELSAESGNKIAQYNLGYLYENGEGVAQSKTKASDWYTKAALQDYAPAQRKLGDLYSGTDRDKAIYWYNKARKSGDEESNRKYSVLNTTRQNDRDIQARVEREKRKEEERKEEEKKKDEERQWQEAQRITRERWAREAEENASTPQRASTPFDGLDSINKVMRDGQRQRATQPRIGSNGNSQRTMEDPKGRTGNSSSSSATDNVKAERSSDSDGKAAIKECAPYMSETVTFPDPSQTEKAHRDAAESNAKWRALGIPFCKYSNKSGPTAGRSK